MKAENIGILEKMKLLDSEGHPLGQAYKIACQTADDSATIVADLWEHSSRCAKCEERANNVLKMIYGR